MTAPSSATLVMWSTTAISGLPSGPRSGVVGVEHVAGGDLEPVAARLEVVGDQVAGDRDQPRAEVAALPGEAADALERAQERVRGEVLGQRAAAHPEVDEPEHGVHVPVVEQPERLGRRPGPARPAPRPRPRRRPARAGSATSAARAPAAEAGSRRRAERTDRRTGQASATRAASEAGATPAADAARRSAPPSPPARRGSGACRPRGRPGRVAAPGSAGRGAIHRYGCWSRAGAVRQPRSCVPRGRSYDPGRWGSARASARTATLRCATGRAERIRAGMDRRRRRIGRPARSVHSLARPSG